MKEELHITVWLRSSVFLSTWLNNMFNRYSKITAIFVSSMFVMLTSCVEAKCPELRPNVQLYDSSALMKKSHIAVERGTGEFPINLALYATSGRKCIRQEFARYSIEGSEPKVESVFFVKIRNQIDLLTIVTWSLNNRGAGTYGKLYQVYGYKLNSRGHVEDNVEIMQDTELTGIEGEDNGEESVFPYKTAADVGKYLMRKRTAK